MATRTQPVSGTRPESDIALQVGWARLLAVVEEQAQALIRTAFSPIVRECGDISAGIFDLSGRMLAQAVTGTPGHVNTMAEAVRSLLEIFSLEAMSAGDVYVTNDPWLASGHLNDLLLVAPVFRRGQPVALVSCTSHLYDIGGLGMGPDGSDVYDEGLFVPPLQLVHGGEINETLLAMVKANSRAAVSAEGDVYALIACCDVGADRLVAMMDELALDDLTPLSDYIVDTSRAGTARAIAEVPPGVYRNAIRLDGYEFEVDLQAALTVAADHMVLDLAGSSGASRYGINVPLNYMTAYAVFGLRSLVSPAIPNNAGSLEPFRVTAPRGSIVAALRPAAVAMRHVIGQLAADLALGCLHEAIPGTVPAESPSCMWDLPLRNATLATPDRPVTAFAFESTHNGGTGARPTKDGLSATAFPSGVWGSQVEVTESTAPILIRRRELRVNSGGAGTWRGGLGQVIEVESAEGAPIRFFAALDRIKHPAQGRAGGRAGAGGRLSLTSQPRLEGMGTHIIPAGERLVLETPGGGGYGDPLRRDPGLVTRDVRLEMVTRETAAQAYAVVIDDAGALDQAATRALREASGAAVDEPMP